MIYTLTLNPSIDQHITVGRLIANDKITPQGIRLEPGGKGFNVARVIQELGGKTKAFGFCGGHAGNFLKDLLNKDKIEHHLCTINAEIRTNLVIKDRASATQTRINPVGPRLHEEDVKRLLNIIENVAPRPAFWVLCGSIPPGVSVDIYKRLIRSFQARGERCVLDTDETPLKKGLQAKPFMIKPNAFELARLIGRACRSQKDILAAGRKLTQSAQVVAITLAKRGAYVFANNEAWHCHAPAVNVKSDVGAGDSFIAGFLTALDRGDDPITCSRWAIAAATSSVINEGTARCRREQVQQLVKRVTIRNVG
jgi:1-phosphofructokinase family hexose kinase